MARKRKMLRNWDAVYIQELIRQIETQSKTTLVTWVVGYSHKVLLPIWEVAYPEDTRPENALRAANSWMSGEIKLPEAKKSILACHEAARDAEQVPAAQAAARAIGQAASTIHSPRHCIGLPLYGALAVAYQTLGEDAAWAQLEECAANECGRMLTALVDISKENEPNPAKINWNC